MSTLTAHFDLPLDAFAPGWARRTVAGVLGSWGLHETDWSDDVSAVVSELVTNAVRHGGGTIVLDLEAHGPDVTVSVADGSAVVPRRREPDGTGGLGLALIEALTRRWFVEPYEGGKRVRVVLRPCPVAGHAGAGTERQAGPA